MKKSIILLLIAVNLFSCKKTEYVDIQSIKNQLVNVDTLTVEYDNSISENGGYIQTFIKSNHIMYAEDKTVDSVLFYFFDEGKVETIRFKIAIKKGDELKMSFYSMRNYYMDNNYTKEVLIKDSKGKQVFHDRFRGDVFNIRKIF